MSNSIKKYDKRGNLIYVKKNIFGHKCWYKYDKNDNKIYTKLSNGYECWKKYDKNNNMIYYKWREQEEWHKYDENNNEIYRKVNDGTEFYFEYYKGHKIEITQQEFKQIERTKLYLNNKRSNRFELIDI